MRGLTRVDTTGQGYAILPDGDIITSDGTPREVDEFQRKMVADQAASEGREITFRFRAPRPDEADFLKVMGFLI